MRVFWVNHFGYDLPEFGESDLKRVDKDYVRITKEGTKLATELYNVAFVWPATEENLAIYHEFAREIKAWKEMEPNIFVALNRMKRS